jgi:hypothetical protein
MIGPVPGQERENDRSGVAGFFSLRERITRVGYLSNHILALCPRGRIASCAELWPKIFETEVLMYRSKTVKCLTAVFLTAAIALPSFGQNEPGAKKEEKAAGGQPSETEMMAMMMEMAKPGENHKLLAHGVGTWSYTVKMWMDPKNPPNESSGTAVIKETLGGRYFVGEHTGRFQMPGPDGKMMDMDFKGVSTEGYDNAKKVFVATWMDNMGTGIMLMEGTYDSMNKSLTYRGETEMMPGMKTKIREVIKITDKDHHTLEWYEDRGGTEVKTMEIAYTRKS